MTRKLIALPILLLAPTLGGCALQAAMTAAQLVQDLPQNEGRSNAHLRDAATQACTQRAAQYGSVFIVDVEQRRADRIIVWGSVTDAEQRRRTFECQFATAIVAFKLREISPTR